mmetsp:Transcript_287/g.523  ORF Transcript_287/g.523 Transcript_287/m.523 type:complete len:303 (+) Transcript_287:85-993(+)
MFRNYDTDVTTWSPAGRLLQVEYALKAVKQGSATVGIRSSNHVVLVSLKRSHSELSSYQQKQFKIDNHMGISIAGLVADARVLCTYMRNECINHRYVYDTPMPPSRLVGKIADKSQKTTQSDIKRPYGVGLLVASYTPRSGPQLFRTCPSGNYYEYIGYAIGARSQSATTFIEKEYKNFDNMPLEELIVTALRALESTIPENIELTEENTSISVIGAPSPSTIFAATPEDGDESLYKEGVPRSTNYTYYDGECAIDSPEFIVLQRALRRLDPEDDGEDDDAEEEDKMADDDEPVVERDAMNA